MSSSNGQSYSERCFQTPGEAIEAAQTLARYGFDVKVRDWRGGPVLFQSGDDPLSEYRKAGVRSADALAELLEHNHNAIRMTPQRKRLMTMPLAVLHSMRSYTLANLDAKCGPAHSDAMKLLDDLQTVIEFRTPPKTLTREERIAQEVEEILAMTQYDRTIRISVYANQLRDRWTDRITRQYANDLLAVLLARMEEEADRQRERQAHEKQELLAMFAQK